MRFVKTTVAMMILLLSSQVFANASQVKGFFVDGGYGAAKAFGRTYPAGQDSKRSLSGGFADIGYKFNPFLAAEYGYHLYANGKIRNTTSTKLANEERSSMHLALKGIIPTNFGLEVFGKIGASRLSRKVVIVDATAASAVGLTASSKMKIGYFYGAGVQYYFLPEFAGLVQWTRDKGDSQTGSMDLYAVGISFLFY